MLNVDNPYTSKKYIVNTLTKEERLKLKESLLDQTIKIIVNPVYGLFTEHGFPVAIALYRKFTPKKNTDFYAKVITTDPMVTIYEIPEE